MFYYILKQLYRESLRVSYNLTIGVKLYYVVQITTFWCTTLKYTTVHYVHYTMYVVYCILYSVYIEKLHCFKIWQQGLLLTHNPALVELYGREPTVYRDTFYTKTILCSTCLEEWTFILFRQVRLLVPCLRIRMSFKLDLNVFVIMISNF